VPTALLSSNTSTLSLRACWSSLTLRGPAEPIRVGPRDSRARLAYARLAAAVAAAMARVSIGPAAAQVASTVTDSRLDGAGEAPQNETTRSSRRPSTSKARDRRHALDRHTRERLGRLPADRLDVFGPDPAPGMLLQPLFCHHQGPHLAHLARLLLRSRIRSSTGRWAAPCSPDPDVAGAVGHLCWPGWGTRARRPLR
jgi:hypothetical protein